MLAARDPHNVVRLILPEGEGDKKYGHAAELLTAWMQAGVLRRDDEPAFYRLEQTFQPPSSPDSAAITRRGFLAAVKLVPFSERVVLPHERTLSGPKEDRLKLFRATAANLSPGFMLYRDERGALDAPLASGEVLADFVALDGVRHVLSKVRDKDAIRAIVEGVARTTLLIADGHHRYETALQYAREVSASHPEAQPRAEHRFFMTFLVNGDDPNLVVFPTHRHVHSLVQFSFDQLVRRAQESGFLIEELGGDESANRITAALARAALKGSSVAASARAGHGALRTVLLTLSRDAALDDHPTLADKPPALRKTDVTVLHAGILEHILGITPEAQAAKTNIWYPQDARAALADLRAGRGDVLFLMNSTPVAEVREVAEASEVMPQKSTFFYPKVPTGLALHTLDPNRGV